MQRTLTCPGCQATFETATQTAGATIKCPRCERSFRVRLRRSEPPAPPPLPPPLSEEQQPVASRSRLAAQPRPTTPPLISAALVTVLGFLAIGILAALVTLAFLAGRSAREEQKVAGGTVPNGAARHTAPDREVNAATPATATATPASGGVPKDLVSLIEEEAKLDQAIQDLRRFLGASPDRRGNHGTRADGGRRHTKRFSSEALGAITRNGTCRLQPCAFW